MFCAPEATWKIPDRVLLQKILHKKCLLELIKTSEIVNDLDSDGGSFSELSDSKTCKINSPFISSSSNSEEEEIVQPEPDRGRKRTCRALPKHANTDFELGWEEKKNQMFQKLVFYGVPEINKNFHIIQYSSSWDMFEIFFSPEMFKHIRKETNRYTTKQINIKKHEGPLKPKPVCAQWNTVSLQEIKFFLIIMHISMLCRSSLRNYWSLCPIIYTPYAASVEMSRDRFFALLTMFHLNNDAEAGRGQPGYDPLFKIWTVTDTLITKFEDVYTPEEQLTIDEAICPFRGRIFFRVYITGKPHAYGIKMFELCEAKGSFVYNLEVYTGAHPTNSEHNMAVSVVDRLCYKIKGKGHSVYMDRWFASTRSSTI